MTWLIILGVVIVASVLTLGVLNIWLSWQFKWRFARRVYILETATIRHLGEFHGVGIPLEDYVRTRPGRKPHVV